MGNKSSINGHSNDIEKLQNFIIMKAFNLRNKGITLNEQFETFVEYDNQEGAYITIESLSNYMKLSEKRKRLLKSLFPNNKGKEKIKYELFLKYMNKNKTNQRNDLHLNEANKSLFHNNNNYNNTMLVLYNKEWNNINNKLMNNPPPPPATTTGLWKKREITIQEKIIEYTKVDDKGIIQNLIEKEKQQIEIIHMETETGEFAHHEITHFEQLEQLNDEIVRQDTGKEEFVHFKSKYDEFSHYESSIPTRQEFETGPPSPTIKDNSKKTNEMEYTDQTDYIDNNQYIIDNEEETNDIETIKHLLNENDSD